MSNRFYRLLREKFFDQFSAISGENSLKSTNYGTNNSRSERYTLTSILYIRERERERERTGDGDGRRQIESFDQFSAISRKTD